MDEQNNLTFTDEEFEKMLRDGLNSSFKDDEICVSEDLIARTMKAIESIGPEEESTDNETTSGEQKSEAQVTSIDAARRKKLYRFYKIAGAVAAAAVLGVVGISVINSGRQMTKNAPKENMAFMMDRAESTSSAYLEESKIEEAVNDCDSCYEFEEDAPMVAAPDFFANSDACDNLLIANGGIECAPEEKAAMVGSVMNNSISDECESDKCDSDEFESEDSYLYESEEDDHSEPIVWNTDSAEINFYPLSNTYFFSGDENENLYNDLYNAAIGECGDVAYEITGFMTADREYLIPEDLGYSCMEVSYMNHDGWNMVTIKVYEYYCEIHFDKPLSSNSEDYSTVLYRVDDGYGLADRLMTMLAPTE